MTEIVTAPTDADFLALLPRIVGFRPERSLVVVLFAGKRTAGAFRVDLPAREVRGHRRLADFLVATARSDPRIDGVALVVYTDETFAAERGIPRRRLVADLERRLLAARLGIVLTLGVADDGWGAYDGLRPVERRELVELELSPLAPAEIPAFDRGELESPGPLAVRAFALASEQIVLRGDVPDPAEHLERCLDSAPDSRELAQLALLLRSAPLRDELMLRAAFGGLVGDVVAERNQRMSALQRERGGSMDDVVGEEIAAGRIDPGDEIDGLLLGRGRLRPDPDRIERLRGVLRHLVPLLVGAERSNPLCMLVWLSWALGHGTAAGRYLDLASAVDPRHGMTALLAVLLDRVPFPEWAPAEPVPAD